MKIVKYNQSKTVQAGSSGSSGGGSGSSTTIEGGGSVSLDRTIWGKHDTGEDIDGTMTVNGDINIKAINYEWEEDDDPEGENVDYEEGGGNLNVELKTTTKDLEVSNDAYIQKHLYINHSHADHNKEKVCLIDEVEKNTKNIDALDTNIQMAETAIRNNADEIEKLKTRSDSSETDISDIITRVENNETNISNNTTEIENIKEQMADGSAINNLLKQIETLKYGDLYNPVILYSGVLSKLSASNMYVNNGCLKDCLLFTITDVSDGVMTIEITPRSDLGREIYCYVRSVDATQEKSHDTESRDNYYKGRSNGAHWFESWFSIEKNKTTIKLREFHQGNGDNDTWYSSSWFEDGSVRAVNLTINGYVTFLS